MKRKSNLDERQEQKLLEIESHGCWLAVWGLVVAMILQVIVYGIDIKQVAGECIVLMTVAVYISIACVKNGIWDRHLKANAKTNFLISLLVAVIVGLVNTFAIIGRYFDKPAGAADAGVISAVVTFVICFLALSISSRAYTKRQKRLEQEPADEMKDS